MLILMGLLIAVNAGLNSAAARSAEVISAGWKLFIDDSNVAERHNLERVWHQPAKYARNPIVRADKPWEGRNAYVYGTVVRQGSNWRMWYQAYNPKVKTRDRTSVCYAVSTDGLRWTKPSLGLIDFHGSRDNNIVLQKAGDSGGSLYSPSVFIDPGDRRNPYKMMWHDSSLEAERGGRSYGVSAAYSADGIRWTRCAENPVSLLSGDALAVIFDPRIGRYVAYVKLSRDGKRSRGRSESTSIVNWPEPTDTLHADERDSPDTHLYWSVHQPYADIYVGLVGVYQTEADTIHTEFVYSRDGVKWQRAPGRRVFLPLGNAGEFDCMMMCAASPPFVEDCDRLLFYYGGFDGPHGARSYGGGDKGEPDQYGGAVGVALLRKDGFASLRADRWGVLVTTPMRGESESLMLNANARGGNIRAEILDCNGRPFPSFTAARCRPVTSDSTRHTVTWTDAKYAWLRGRSFSIRLILENAEIYSVRP